MKLLNYIIFLLLTTISYSQVLTIPWGKNTLINGKPSLFFSGAEYRDTLNFPYFSETISIQSSQDLVLKISSYKIDTLSADSLTTISNISNLPTDFLFTTKKVKLKQCAILLLPLRRNPTTGIVERITEFTLVPSRPVAVQPWAANSVLKSGKWVKIKVLDDGVYKLSYSELSKLGLGNPGNVRIYGYGSGMLPRDNAVARPSDLQELPVQFVEQQPGTFKEGDYIVFYAEGSTQWSYNKGTKMFLHTLHSFANGSYYFLTSDLGRGKTMQSVTSLTSSPTHNVTSFDDFKFTETEETNLCGTGSRWFGKELFSTQLTYTFNYLFPNAVAGSGKTRISLAWKSNANSELKCSLNGTSIGSLHLGIAEGDDCFYRCTTGIKTFSYSSENLSLVLSYNKFGSTASMAVLDAIDINVRRNLIMNGSQMIFRDINSVGTGNISQFSLSGVTPNTSVWEITNINNVSAVQGKLSGSTFSFVLATDILRKFIAFDNTKLLTPIITGNDLGTIENQDLHGMTIPNLLIVYHPDFKSQAEKLASHRQSQGMKVASVTPQQIYNEFSMGSPDVQAIRDFARMLYDKDPNTFKYLLLFGDGSYDNRPVIIKGNTNYIITYQDYEESSASWGVQVSDDFFGLLGPTEKADSGFLDIGVGRFPVYNKEQADAVVNKVIHYDSPQTLGSWRNNLCFIADDREDDNFTFLKDADHTAARAQNVAPGLNITKIYLDAYKQIVTSSGQSCPDAARALNDIVHKGTVLLDFTGHGGQDGITSENLYTRNVIDTWRNKDRLFMLFTASCKVARFDYLPYENGQYSPYITAGEYAVLKEDAGAVCAVSTNRDTYAAPNTRLNNALVDHISNNNNETDYRLGDIYLRAKNSANFERDKFDENTRSFILLGDPSMKFAIPALNRVVTDSINGATVANDTIKALEEVTLKGHIVTASGSPDPSFNGSIAISIFDKNAMWETISNHGYELDTFYTQQQTIIKGNATVKNGAFSFRFMAPKDINYNVGSGKISYYATDGKIDLNGYDTQIKIGGLADNNRSDNTGPVIRLFMNDTTFRNGGITDDSPSLLAIIEDDCGINATGASIGHDIIATLDNDENQKFILNNYYETDLDNYQRGRITYPFSKLSVGRHTLKLIVWDAMNNSSEAEIQFVVTSGKQLIMQNIVCYPNPMTDYTNFVFDHNMPGEDMQVTIQIFDLAGMPIKTIVTSVNTSGYSSTPILWDGSANGGNTLGNGIYIYRITAEVPKEGVKASGSAKLIIAR